MANGASYLTPQFLMSQLNQLLRVDRAGAKKGVGTALTKDEFKDKYYTGEIDPGGQGRSRLYYDFNFGDEFIEMVEKNSPLYYDSPQGRQELGLTPKDYFKNLIKDSRERTKERLFPQESFNLNNLLSMLGSN